MSVAAPAGVWGHLRKRSRARGRPRINVWEAVSAEIDPGEYRPKLARDIEIKEFKLRWGNDYAMIANPRDLIHYRLEPGEVEILKLLDGSRTVKEIVVERFKDSGALELSGVADLVALLREGNFLDRPFVDVEEAVERALHPISKRRAKLREFAKTLSIEWEGADRMVRWLYDHGLKWFFNRTVAILGMALAVAGFVAFVLIAGSGDFGLTGESLAIGFVVLLVLDYVMVFVHELGHALVLTHNGRRIRSAGFQIYFGSPAFFVDGSDGAMMERGPRILESFGGPYAQMLLAAIASLFALTFPDWFLSETLYRYAVLNYLVLFMNLIPLLELDGYWILSDVIQVPELRPMSLSFIRHDLWHKLIKRERFTKQEIGLAVYGIAGVLFTVFSFYTAYFYWQTIFGDFVARMWDAGLATRILLLALALFVAGPLFRAGINLLRSLARRTRAVVRRIRFTLERGWRVEAAELIDALPLFEEVPEEVLGDIAGRVRLRAVARGQPVVRQGEPAEAFYVVRRGALQVVEEDPDTGNERVLRVLGRGESFGELGLLERKPRAATVRALEEAELFEIDKGTFDRLLADMVRLPEFAPTLQALAELRALPPFAHLEPDVLRDLLEHGEWRNVRPGQTIVKEGEVSDAFYAIGAGRVDVFEGRKRMRTQGTGSYFGEIGLLLNIRRTATVRAITPVRVFRLDRKGFNQLVRASFKRGTLRPQAAIERFKQH